MDYLLNILKRERDAYDSIRIHEEHASAFQKRLEEIGRIDIDCDSRIRDLEIYRSLVDRERGFIEFARTDLANARSELRKYLTELFKGEES